ncbi:amidase family protein [Actinoplanes sp. NPDC020271]|uniref:amidase family protein n=1 Tax=Actinoplanes sp. NPDC020271 TaxID=3363896 RepID=UPI00379B7F01
MVGHPRVCRPQGTDIIAVTRAAADRLATAGVIEWVDHDLVLTDPADAWHALRRGDHSSPALASRADNDRRLAAAFQAAEVLLTPTAPVSAHGHDGPGETISVSLTRAFNLSGHPAASVPAGMGPDGVPIGMQIVAPFHAEATVLCVAGAVCFARSPCRSLKILAPPVGSPVHRAHQGHPSRDPLSLLSGGRAEMVPATSRVNESRRTGFRVPGEGVVTVTFPGDGDGDQGGNGQLIMWITLCLAPPKPNAGWRPIQACHPSGRLTLLGQPVAYQVFGRLQA